MRHGQGAAIPFTAQYGPAKKLWAELTEGLWVGWESPVRLTEWNHQGSLVPSGSWQWDAGGGKEMQSLGCRCGAHGAGCSCGVQMQLQDADVGAGYRCGVQGADVGYRMQM